jgi:hypothetical protein
MTGRPPARTRTAPHFMDGSNGIVWLRLIADDLAGAREQLDAHGCQLSPVPSGYLLVDPHGARFYLTEDGT